MFTFQGEMLSNISILLGTTLPTLMREPKVISPKWGTSLISARCAERLKYTIGPLGMLYI
jgi:hypothetical protein